MLFNMHDFKSNISSFLAYRSAVGYSCETTRQSNAVDLKLFADFMDSNNKQTVSGADVIAFQQHLAGVRNNTGASINRKIFTLRSFQNYLELKGDENAQRLPFKKVLKIRVAKPYRANFLSQEEISGMFASINTGSVIGMRDYTVCAAMFLLGLRVGEAHRLNLEHIDWDENTITVTGKCAVERTLPLSKELKTILENYLTVRPYFYKSEHTPAFFVSKKGRRLAIRTIEDNFKKLIRAAGINKDFQVTPHTLRHTCATMLNEKEVKILTIQNIMGHATPDTVVDYYLHTPQHIMREAMENLPLSRYINQLIDNGRIRLTFQKHRYRNTG
jgi:site-specific recombinase XerD